MKVLAWRLCKQKTKNIKKNPITGKISNNVKDIQNSFEHFYRTLYSQLPQVHTQSISHFLDSVDLPSIGTEQNKILMAAITPE